MKKNLHVNSQQTPELFNSKIPLSEMNEIHSKVTMVRRMVRRQLKESPESRIIVFANFRDTVDEISRVLSDVENAVTPTIRRTGE